MIKESLLDKLIIVLFIFIFGLTLGYAWASWHHYQNLTEYQAPTEYRSPIEHQVGMVLLDNNNQ